MLRTFKLVAILGALVITSSAMAAPSGSRQAYYRPLTFFVAKGAPDACGTGCSEWIAVEGRFDLGSAGRFREFLKFAYRRALPVYFHSIGGSGNDGEDVGRILREFRMTASVGRTTLKGCSAVTVAAEECNHLIRDGTASGVRLADGFCNSACVFALAGASVRVIPANAHIGIHSPKPLPEARTAVNLDAVMRAKKRYLVEVGIDPTVLDAALKTPSDRMHRLTRQEIARYGIETRPFFETTWFADQPHWPVSHGRYDVIKSWTVRTEAGGATAATTTIRFGCIPNRPVEMIVTRERWRGEPEERPAVAIRLGDAELKMVPEVRAIGGEVRRELVTLDSVQRALSNGAITVAVNFANLDRTWSRTVTISTRGLAESMPGLQKYCAPQPDERVR